MYGNIFLIMNIKNSCLLHPSHVFRARKAKETKLNTEITNLKKDYSHNVNNILIKERELAIVTEIELKKELKHIKKFERLNNEKITPYFMMLTKKAKKIIQ